MNNQTNEKWCLGLKLKESRPLSKENKTWLKRKIWKTNVYTFSFTILYIVGLISIGFLRFLPEAWMMGLGFSYFLLGLTMLIYISSHNIRLIKALIRDYKSGNIEYYENITAESSTFGKPLGNIEKGMEVFQFSKSIYKIDNEKVKKTILVETSLVAPQANDTFSAPISPDMFIVPDKDISKYRQRHITEEEKEEIIKIIGKLLKVSSSDLLGAFFAIICSALLLIALFFIILNPAEVYSLNGKEIIMLLVLIFSSVGFYNRFIPRITLSKKLRKDIALGIMLINNISELEKSLQYEILPVSMAYWTFDGKPAPLRTCDLRLVKL